MWLARIAMVIVLFVSQRADAETQAYWAGSMAKRTVVATVVIAKQPMMFVYERDAKSNVTSSKGWTLDGKEVASVEALPDAVQKRVAASRTPRLSARTRSAALRYLDGARIRGAKATTRIGSRTSRATSRARRAR
jgi:hypothetical protein